MNGDVVGDTMDYFWPIYVHNDPEYVFFSLEQAETLVFKVFNLLNLKKKVKE